MKRFLLLIVMMTAVAVTTYAQSVLGIKIGESYSNAKNTLRERYGYKCYEFLGEEEDGVTIHGDITLTRTKGKDNVERLYLFLSYYPIADFIQEDSDF